ncbi:Predicted arabinose efflux permease, MFS family [Monaibacterium marinum]|uniref:Predicted arabinose efflux permease, MFS family n=1 Tax=Pontivivens marinum TaxID=1690039 RepID=A0A2C9CT17_9RHOB|nr:MFS transporter [Monaibacterium marinum]SOH94402.1 Predicted arabinose efflux permease, MFS family [Monaibacterium marinum]
MVKVFSNSWALFIGVLLLMIGNGLQGTLLGLRGAFEGFDASVMAWVMSAYFAGFLFGSRMAPGMIQRVGHVRVFAALASLISAGFILYAAVPDPIAWAAMRFVVGFCFSGVYVVCESWLNDASTNETRGKTLSLYMIVQMLGIISAQFIVNFADASSYILFVVMSVLVSVSFAPILLSATPAPVFQGAKPMTLRQLYITSPLGCVGMFFMGAVFAGMFGMSAVYGAEKGLSVADITTFVAVIYLGGMVLQYPIGWMSDRMDRRRLITFTCLAAAATMIPAAAFAGSYIVLLIAAFVLGGLGNPLYSLLIAYTADYLEPEDMAAASGGLMFINGSGAVLGPFIVGAMMTNLGPDFFFVFMALNFAIIAGYGLYRMTRRAAPSVEDTASYAYVAPQASPVAVEVAQEYAIDLAEQDEEAAEAEATVI